MFNIRLYIQHRDIDRYNNSFNRGEPVIFVVEQMQDASLLVATTTVPANIPMVQQQVSS
jgi:hypothetical protein